MPSGRTECTTHSVVRHSDISESGPALCGDDHILGDSAYRNLPFPLTPFKDNCPEEIQHHTCEDQEMRELYEASHGFPGVVGMIDGTHFAYYSSSQSDN